MKLTDKARAIFNAGLRAIYNDLDQRTQLDLPTLMQPPEVDFVRQDLPDGSLAIQVGWDVVDGAPVMLQLTEPDDGPMGCGRDTTTSAAIYELHDDPWPHWMRIDRGVDRDPTPSRSLGHMWPVGTTLYVPRGHADKGGEVMVDDGPMVMSNDGNRGVRGLVEDALRTLFKPDDYADVTVPPEDASDLMHVANVVERGVPAFEKLDLRGPGLCLRFRITT